MTTNGDPVDMVEVVARALARRRYSETLPESVNLAVEDGWRDFISDARAAIEAMRVPTEAMVDAGHDEAPMCELGVPLVKPCREFNRAAYTAMIDAALTPPQPEKG